MYKALKTTCWALALLMLCGYAYGQTWQGPGSGNSPNSIFRSGNVGIGLNTVGIAPLDVRGDNIYLAPPNTTGFSSKFIGLGESGGDCGKYGFRAQRNSSSYVNVGIKEGGFNTGGFSTPFNPTISWGSNTFILDDSCAFPFPCFTLVNRSLDFEFDSNQEGCGDLVAQMFSLTDTFQFRVYGDALANGSWVNSDRRFKTGIKTIEGALDMVTQLRGTSYGYKQEAFPLMNFKQGRTNGFIAQEIKEVMPEVVTQNRDGYLSVNYDAVIPVLVEAIKEQNSEIEDLKRELAEIKMLLTGGETNKSNLDEVTGADQGAASRPEPPADKRKEIGLDQSDPPQLFQNLPNPFDGVTKIPYYLPPTAGQAQLIVNNINGQEMLRMELSQRGSSEVTLDANTLKAGVYTYSLTVDGERVATRRMVVGQ